MWIFAIIMFANGILGKKICDKPHFIACETTFPTEFPRTTQELNRLCPLAMNYYDCLINYERTCNLEDPRFRNGEYENIKSIIVNACTNGTMMHKALFGNIKCIGDLVANHYYKCNNDSQQVLRAFRDAKKTTKSQDADTESMKEMCMYGLYEMGCFLTTASTNCGPTVKDAIVNGIIRSYFPRSQCTNKTINELKDMAKNLKMSDSQKNVFNESLRILI